MKKKTSISKLKKSVEKTKDLRVKANNYPRAILEVKPLGKPAPRPVKVKRSPPPIMKEI